MHERNFWIRLHELIRETNTLNFSQICWRHPLRLLPQWPAITQALRAERKYQSSLKIVDGKVVKEHCSSVIFTAFAIFYSRVEHLLSDLSYFKDTTSRYWWIGRQKYFKIPSFGSLWQASKMAYCFLKTHHRYSPFPCCISLEVLFQSMPMVICFYLYLEGNILSPKSCKTLK